MTLEGITKGKAVEKETVHELDNIKCRFSPHVQAASIGQFVYSRIQIRSSIPHMPFHEPAASIQCRDFILDARAENR